MVNDDYSNIWEIYGLNSDPFSPVALSVSGSPLSLDTFIGRTEELKNLKNNFRSGESRTIVSGNVGVGKTTLVNYARAKAMKSGSFFTPINELEMQSHWQAEDLIMATLASIYNTIKIKKDFKIDAKVLNKLKALVDVLDISSFSLTGSFMGYGLGGAKEKSVHVPKLTLPILKELFIEVLNALRKSGFKETIIHYNNLENFSESELIRLFKNVRDFILTPNTHFVFVGGLTVPKTLQKIDKVISVMSDPLILENFSSEEIKKIISRRIFSLTLEGYEPPKMFEDRVIDLLYKLFKGNTRNILNSLSTAIKKMTEERAIVLNVDSLSWVLSKHARTKWLDKLTKEEERILYFILDVDEITNSELANKSGRKRQNISTSLRKLLEMRAIKLKRKEGNKKYFCAHYPLKWALLKRSIPEPKKAEEQKELLEILGVSTKQ